MTRKPRHIPVIGERFGRLTVIALAEKTKKYRLWRCRCDCGNDTLVRSNQLNRSSVQSCGCLVKDAARDRGVRAVQRRATNPQPPAESRSVEYRTWGAIIYRCTNPTAPHWKHYGGRGITICDEWRRDYRSFLAHMGRRPSADHSIDRINNDRGYEPGNVRWAVPVAQARNRSTATMLTAFGKTMSAVEWAETVGLNYGSLLNRIVRHGWSVERALTTPPSERGGRGKFAAGQPEFIGGRLAVEVDHGC